MAKHFSKKEWSSSPLLDRQHKNQTGGDAPKKELLKREARRQTDKTHGTEKRPGGKQR